MAFSKFQLYAPFSTSLSAVKPIQHGDSKIWSVYRGHKLVWRVYKVKFVDWDGTQLGEEQEVVLGHSAIQPANPTREGYIFDRWEPQYTNIQANTTISAQYRQDLHLELYAVPPFGGTVEGDGIYTQGERVLVTASPAAGYSFSNWSDGGSQSHTIVMNESKSLSAYFIQSQLFSVIFKDWNGRVLKYQTVGYGADAIPPTSPTREGYAFDHWEGTWTHITSDQVVIAAYTHTYTVSFIKQGGEGGDDSVVATYGQLLPTIQPPTLAGYYFTGYYLDPTGISTQYYAETGESEQEWDIAEDTNLYAVWSSPKREVVFETDGGSACSSRIVAIGEPIGELPETTMTKPDGYARMEFDGWWTAAEGGEEVTSETIMPPGAEPFTVYAHWLGILHYENIGSVTIDANGIASGFYGDQNDPNLNKYLKIVDDDKFDFSGDFDIVFKCSDIPTSETSSCHDMFSGIDPDGSSDNHLMDFGMAYMVDDVEDPGHHGYWEIANPTEYEDLSKLIGNQLAGTDYLTGPVYFSVRRRNGVVNCYVKTEDSDWILNFDGTEKQPGNFIAGTFSIGLDLDSLSDYFPGKIHINECYLQLYSTNSPQHLGKYVLREYTPLPDYITKVNAKFQSNARQLNTISYQNRAYGYMYWHVAWKLPVWQTSIDKVFDNESYLKQSLTGVHGTATASGASMQFTNGGRAGIVLSAMTPKAGNDSLYTKIKILPYIVTYGQSNQGPNTIGQRGWYYTDREPKPEYGPPNTADWSMNINSQTWWLNYGFSTYNRGKYFQVVMEVTDGDGVHQISSNVVQCTGSYNTLDGQRGGVPSNVSPITIDLSQKIVAAGLKKDARTTKITFKQGTSKTKPQWAAAVNAVCLYEDTLNS